MVSSLAPLRDALDRAADRHPRIEVWWRDDDAVAATPALDRLLRLARDVGAPVAVAAIPARTEPSLVARLAEESSSRILVHGLAHANHAGPDRKSAEFGDDRPGDVLSAEAAAALEHIRGAAPDLLLPVFVPPWNRIAPGLAVRLPALGYRGLSVFGPRAAAVSNLAIVNTHLDPVDWRGSRSAVAPERLAGALSRALAGPHAEPIGLLTHHLAFDERTWDLTATLVELLAGREEVCFPPLATLFGAQEDH